jgi:hypothetical protein
MGTNHIGRPRQETLVDFALEFSEALILSPIVLAFVVLSFFCCGGEAGYDRGFAKGACSVRCESIGEARLRDGACECVVGVTPAGELRNEAAEAVGEGEL